MKLSFRKSSRTQAKIRAAITGPSGSGKTYSALLLAFGLTQDWSKIVVIDTENGSADLYAHLGEFNVITMDTPFSPERYIQAFELAEQQDVEVIIIDSLSHGWEYLLDVHSNMPGNSFTNWGKITPRQNKLIQKMLQSASHVVATMRTKQDYVLNQKNGKHVPEKVGLKTIQREGVDYEFTIVFELFMNHIARASKDRTGVFANTQELIISEETGEMIKSWCEMGISEADFIKQINESKSVEELMKLYKDYPMFRVKNKALFTQKKEELNAKTAVETSFVNNTPIESFEDLNSRRKEVYND
jgi:hypothetical protein